MCAERNGVVEPIDPPLGAVPGDRVVVEPFLGKTIDSVLLFLTLQCAVCTHRQWLGLRGQPLI